MRIEVRKIRGRIVPCDSCNVRIRCSMFRSLAMNRSRDPQWTHATNRLHSCDLYVPEKSPK